MKNKKASRGILIDIALLLVCLVCITTCLSSGIMARFVSRTDSADKARAAKFDVSVSASDTTATLSLDQNTAEYSMKISNHSETAVSYSLIITFENDVTDLITAKVGDREFHPDSSGKIICIDDIGVIQAGKDVDAVFSLIVNNAFINGLTEIVFSTDVRFVQVD
ncbi:MAG: hypothetical protein IKO51_06250 [Clostridia bacterium]|nr:hypothetical protein [Clostridia bacterium]